MALLVFREDLGEHLVDAELGGQGVGDLPRDRQPLIVGRRP